MKKTKTILILVIFAVFISLLPIPLAAETYDYDFPMEEGYDEESFAAAKLRGVQGMTDEEKEEDFEAFWEILEKSYPMYDYLQRYGVNPEEIKARYKLGIYNLYDNASWYNYFNAMLDEFMLPEPEAGHLGIVALGNSYLNTEYQTYHYELENSPEDPWISLMETVFANPHVLGFYSLEKEKREPGAPRPFIDIPDNLHIEYSEEYDYAYVKIDSFLNENPEDDEILIDFFLEAEARGINNVIFDIRGNLGGYNDYWMMNLVSPNISEPITVNNYGLYKDSDWSEPYLSYYDGNLFFKEFEKDDEEVSVSEDNDTDVEAADETEDLENKDEEKLSNEEELSDEEEYELSEEDYATVTVKWERSDEDLPEMEALIEGDVENLDKVFIEQLRVAPSFEEPLFTGKFWILCDEQSYSASEYFISFAKRTGFAEIVGTQSGGDGSCVITLYNALPQSGLLIRYNALYGLNPDGSATEESATPPDYEIQPGEDAFNKAVGLIATENAEAETSTPE